MTKRLLLLCGLIISYFASLATHIVGGEMNYRCLGNNLYEITLTVYRDCYNGVPPFDNPATIGIFDVNGVRVQNLSIAFKSKQTLPPTTAQANVCIKTPSNVCVEVTQYIDTVVLPPRTGGYQLSYQRCCRNNTITNLANPGNQGATYYATIPDPGLATCNSNPKFNNWPPIFVCVNNPVIFDHSSKDFDGDSIVYSLCAPFTGLTGNNPGPSAPTAPPYTQVNYAAGYTASNPMGGSNPLTINSSTGLITGVPPQIGQFVIGVCANEYRNGKYVSTTKRDFQFNVINCQPDVSVAVPNVFVNCNSKVATFTNTSIGATKFLWNFGDTLTLADTSTTKDPTYTYPAYGTYNVILIAYSNLDPKCNDTLFGYPVTVDSCKACAMTLSTTKTDATCGTKSSASCSAIPVPLGDWSSQLLSVTDPCPGKGNFMYFNGVADPYGTSTDKSYYLCNADFINITGGEWSNKKLTPADSAATKCFGTGFYVMDKPGSFAYLCPCQLPVCTRIIDTVPCAGTVSFTYGNSTSPASCLGVTQTTIGNQTPSTVTLIVNGVTITPSDPPLPGPGVVITTTNATHANCPSKIKATGSGTSIVFDYYLWIPSTSGSGGTGSPGTATVIPASGTPNYSYAWSPSGGNSATAGNLAAGTYTVSVVDANGCMQTTSVIIDANSTITLTPSQTPVSACGLSDATASVTPSGGKGTYTYSWSNGQTGATATGLGNGSVTVFVTDSAGCSKSNTFTINAPLNLSVTATHTDVRCKGASTGVITVNSPTSGVGPYTYLWSTQPAVTDSFANGLKAGYYVVTVTDANGCTGTTAATISDSSLVSTSSSTNVVCFGGNSGTATVTAGKGSPAYSYSWSTSPVQTTATATGLTVGTYSVTVTDAAGCTVTSSVTLTEPTALKPETQNTSTINCAGVGNGSAQVLVGGGTTPYTYSWCNGSSASTVSGLAQGQCVVMVTDASGCQATDTITITFPTPLTVTSTGSSIACNGDKNGAGSANILGGTPGFTYTWSSGQTSSTITNLSGGIYTVTVTDAQNCTATTTLNIIEPAAITILPTVTNAGCNTNNGKVIARTTGGTPAYSYLWNTTPAQTDSVVTALSPGSYVVEITDSNGCKDTANVTVTGSVSTAKADFKYDLTLSCKNGVDAAFTNLSSGSVQTYMWIFGDGTTSTDKNPVHNYNFSQTVTVTLVAIDGGCTDTLKAPLATKAFDDYLRVPNVFTPNGDGKNDCFEVSAMNYVLPCVHLTVYDRWGLKMYDNENGACWDGKHNGKDVPDGTYFYLIKIGDTGKEAHGALTLIR